MPQPPKRVLASACCAVLLLSACGNDGGDPVEEVADDIAAVPDAPGAEEGTAGVEVTGEADAKPAISVPDGQPPARLHYQDLIVGDGDVAEAASTVTTHYVGLSWSDSVQFDASWDRGNPVSFGLDQVIPGWTQGIPGMRAGGRRLLVIPPELAYGDMPPAGSGIAPGETLVFVVDLVDVQ